jgi:uncharacterized protein YkwD
MNVIDAVLAIVVLLSALAGVRRGFVAGALQLITLVASLVLAFLGYRWVADWLEEAFPTLGVWGVPLAFIATFIVLHLVMGALASALVQAFARKLHAAGPNRALGVLPGFANGLINATVLSLILLTMPSLGRIGELARESEIAARLSAPAEWLESRLSPIFDPAVRRTLQAITVPPESRSSVQLRFKVSNANVRPDLEQRMLELVNAERGRQGLRPLKPDPELAEVARAHSRDMLARGYFSHVDPDGQDAFDRMRAADLRYLTAGENLALAPTLGGAHQGLMNSPGHRANVLRPQFGRLGVGVLDAGVHGLMVTQKFRN